RFLTEKDYLSVYHPTSNVFNNKSIPSKEKQKDKEINVAKQVNFSAASHPNTNTNNDSHTTHHHNNSNSAARAIFVKAVRLNVLVNDFLSDVDGHVNPFTNSQEHDADEKHNQSHDTTGTENILWAEIKLAKRIKFLFVKGTFQLFLKKLIFDNQNLLLYRPSEKSYEQMNTLFLDVLSETKITLMSQDRQANQTIPRNDILRRRTTPVKPVTRKRTFIRKIFHPEINIKEMESYIIWQ
ncbi:hypothetical protein RFI_39058, partial [Reticulomyxa filosa]